jgi:hypothetical protein
MVLTEEAKAAASKTERAAIDQTMGSRAAPSLWGVKKQNTGAETHWRRNPKHPDQNLSRSLRR